MVAVAQVVGRPRPAANEIPLIAQEGKQEQALRSRANICIFGGAAGGGKTYALLLDPLRYINTPGFFALVLRSTYKQVFMPGALWDEACGMYPYVKGVPNKSSHSFIFPSGARIEFSYLELESDKMTYDGAQICCLEFDQLEHYSESQFWYMLIRNRSTCGVKPYVRATCNPLPDSWLSRLLEWWINQETGYPIPERSGVVRWFIRQGNDIIWADSKRELLDQVEPDSGIVPTSFTFIPSSVHDNKILLHKDPGYLSRLLSLPLIERERFLLGNWKIKSGAGKVFNRAWFQIVDAAPAGGVDCRFWDFAGTEKELKSGDPDYAAAVKMRFVNGIFYVLDAQRARKNIIDTERDFENLAGQDAQVSAQSGSSYVLRWEIEPGSMSHLASANLAKKVSGLDAHGVIPQGDKVTRAKPFASQAEAGNVKLVRGCWNEDYLDHLHNQPDIKHDDLMDASSGCHRALTTSGWVG